MNWYVPVSGAEQPRVLVPGPPLEPAQVAAMNRLLDCEMMRMPHKPITRESLTEDIEALKRMRDEMPAWVVAMGTREDNEPESPVSDELAARMAAVDETYIGEAPEEDE
jgi:hypothetical protein